MAGRRIWKGLDPKVFLADDPLRALRDGFLANGGRTAAEANDLLASHLATALFKDAHGDDFDARAERMPSELRRKWRLAALQRKESRKGITKLTA
jgi:hypothetical protein